MRRGGKNSIFSPSPNLHQRRRAIRACEALPRRLLRSRCAHCGGDRRLRREHSCVHKATLSRQMEQDCHPPGRQEAQSLSEDQSKGASPRSSRLNKICQENLQTSCKAPCLIALLCRNQVSCNAPMWRSALSAVVLGPTGHVLEKKGEDAVLVESPSRRRLACRMRDSAAMRSAAPDED